MTIEIVSTVLHKGTVMISCIDCSEENMSRWMRERDDGTQKEFEIVIDTSDPKQFISFRNWMMRQRCTEGKKTWGDAIRSLTGTITESYGIGKYRVSDLR